MPRIARKNFETSFFHVLVQGINKEFIFNSNKMKKEYLKLLKKCNKENQIQIIAYCIMSNHAHLLIYVDDIKAMSKYMHEVNTNYAIFYNYINKQRVGYVFRDRYKTQAIFSQEQLGKCINYIHKNPVKAKMVKSCEQYEYSSYQDYVKTKNLAPILKEMGLNDIYQIQKIEDSEEFLEEEIDKEKILDDRIREFSKKYEGIEEIKKNKEKLTKLVKYLKEGYQIHYTDIMKKLNLTKGQMERLKR